MCHSLRKRSGLTSTDLYVYTKYMHLSTKMSFDPFLFGIWSKLFSLASLFIPWTATGAKTLNIVCSKRIWDSKAACGPTTLILVFLVEATFLIILMGIVHKFMWIFTKQNIKSYVPLQWKPRIKPRGKEFRGASLTCSPQNGIPTFTFTCVINAN